MDSNPGKTSTENINEVILRLLRLKSGTELDYQTYFNILKKKIASHRLVGKELPLEEQTLLDDELKRVWRIKDRSKRVTLKEKKTKVSPPPPPSGSGGGEDTPPKTSAIVKAPPSGKITTEKLFNTPRVEPVNVRDITPDRPSQVDPLIRISNILDSILETLTNINNFDREQATRQRTDAENRRRGQRETDLESKPFEGIKKALSAITKPFQSIWDRIVNFITNVILGRIVIKLLEWFGDPKNQEKIQSIIRFLGDHWPTLLALYLRFGTGIGRFVGKLTRSLVKGSFKLVKLVAGLAAKLGLKRAGKISSFLGGPRGKAIATGVGIAADVAVTAGTAFGASKLFGGEDKKQEPVAPEPVQQFSGGGSVKIPKFAGGGFANFGNMFKGAGMGSMFGPMGMLAGAALGSGKPQEMVSGLVKGPGGPKDDKIAANLSNGEFVMSAGAVKKYGVDTLESMNAAGGGTNIPKIANGIVHAAGGGLVGDVPINWLTSSMSDEGAKSLAQSYSSMGSNSLGLTSDEWYKAFKRYKGVPDFDKLLGEGKPFTKWESTNKPLSKEQLDTIRQVVRGNNPGSAYSVPRSITGSQSAQLRQTGPKLRMAEIDSSRMLPSAGQSSASAMRSAARTATVSRTPKFASELSPSYFLRGQSSPLPENYSSRSPINSNPIGNWTDAEKRLLGINDQSVFDRSQLDASRSRTKINSNSSFNRYRPGATLRATGAGLEKFPELARFSSSEGALSKSRNLMPSARGGRGGMVGTIALALSEIFKPQIQSALGSLYNKMGIGLGNLSDAELKKQIQEEMQIEKGINSGPLASINSQSERLTLLKQESERRNPTLKGGAIKGGYGLKEQSFKDAPKTSIITDDKGRPSIGHKALRNGKLHYVRDPRPGTGTKNPLEMLGRFINPSAYKENDAKLGRQKHKEAMVNALEGAKAQGMAPDAQARMMKQMGGNLKDVQNDLNYRNKPKPKPNLTRRQEDIAKYKASMGPKYSAANISSSQRRRTPNITPLPRPKPKPIVAGGGSGGRGGGGSRPSSGSKVSYHSATHSRGTSLTATSLGIWV
jgi:hypothetical protein